MLGRIVQGLLCDTVEFLFDLERQVGFVAQVGLDRNSVAGLECRGLLDERRDEPLGLQGLRTQLKDQRTHLGQPRLGQPKDIVQWLGYLAWVTVKERAGGMGPQRDAVERLGDRIVQLARQLLPLLQRRQFLRLFIEPRIFNRNGGLVGNRQRERRMALGKGLLLA